MNPKDIDRLFQEQLKNLEATPNKRVWSAIEGKLVKKKRSVLPMWWFSGGVAALLVIGLMLFPFSEDTNNNKNNTIITETPDKQLEINKNFPKNIDSLFLNEKEETMVAEEKTDINFQKKNENVKNVKAREKTIVAKNNLKITALISSKNENKKVFLASNIEKNKLEIRKKKVFDKIKISKEKPVFTNTDIIKFENEKNPIKIKKQQDIINKKINLDKTLKAKKDFLAVVKKEKVLKKEENKKIKKTWSISPVVAILNSNSFSDTSPIDNNLSNSTTGKNTFSFGVQVAYKINNKWSIQSGIHQQKMSYQNNNITVLSLRTNNTSSAVFTNANSFNANNNLEALNFADISLINSANVNGDLSQEYGYIEIPLEIKYNVFNTKKFDSQLVAGFSSLFLNTNTVELNTTMFNESIPANNLNSVNFSSNFGIDFNYHFNTNWSLNLNPMLKVQLNTFNKNANGFSPFNVGAYIGVKYNL